tara:strand:+ start:1760 stop:1963 length:204 start_codon:yes stop_codon:yes gene_type:complete
MHRFRIDEWVMYHQFPAADTEWLRKGKRAVILEHLENGKYKIYVDDPDLDEQWRIKKVNEAVLKAID